MESLRVVIVFGAALLGFLGMVVNANQYYPVEEFDVNVERMFQCKKHEEKDYEAMHFQTNVYNVSSSEKIYNASWTLPDDFDDEHWSVWVKATQTAKDHERGKGDTFFMHFDEPCSMALEYMGEFFQKVADAAGFQASCPIPKGDYAVENLELNVPPPVKLLPLDEYEVVIIFSYIKDKDDKLFQEQGCIGFIARLTNKNA